MVVGGTAAATFLFFPLPAVVPDPIPGATAQTSYVYAADGSLIATFHAEFNRQLIEFEDMPKHLRDATIALEDARFYQHSGTDPKGILRALFADIRAGSAVQGGSTITQQYVKNAYIEKPKRTIFRKVREVLIASQIEKTHSKDKILKDYLNTVYLGKGAYGVEAAAKTYFGKAARDLTLSESALIVGLIAAPVRYSPFENPDGAEARRTLVIDRMERLGMIDKPTADAARAEKPALSELREEVFRFPWFVDALRTTLIRKYGEQKIFAGGLRIHSTIDPKMQEAAEKVLADTLDRPDDPHAALASVDPKTGYVRALVGGRSYADEKFNIAFEGRRQPGSAFKTFVLVAALSDKIKASSTFSGPSVLRIKGWGNECQCVRNYGNAGYGRLTLESATIRSVNTVYVQVAQRVGVEKIIDTALAMGITERSLEPDRENLAIAIGGHTYGVTSLEMASSYATLAAGGVYRAPKFVSKIIDGDGKVLESGPSEGVQAIDPSIAYTATNILKKVVQSGTAQRADIGRPAAGKTGTAQDYENAWFVGYTPELSTAIWMGYRSENAPMRNVHGVRNVTGGTLPARMWAAFMKLALEDIAASDFSEPGRTQNDDRFRLPYRSPPSPSPSPPPPEPSPTPEPSPSPKETGPPQPPLPWLP